MTGARDITAPGRISGAGQRRPDPAHGLADPLLVLDEREADVPLAAGPEADARADGDLAPRFVSLSANSSDPSSAVRLRDRRPDEHRAAGLRELPADTGETVAERVAARAVDLVHERAGTRGASFIAMIEAIWIGWNVP